MKIPSQAKQVGTWAEDVVNRCSASLVDRLQRGMMYKNLYLTGSEQGEPQTFPKTYSHIDSLSSNLYSPKDLKFNIEHYGAVDSATRAQLRVAATEVHKQMRRGGVDKQVATAVEWGLVKGINFIKQLWTSNGIKATLVQPECMGVLEENLDSLDDQSAFFHRTYVTIDRLARLLQHHPDKDNLLRKARTYQVQGSQKSSDFDNVVKQIVLGGLSPYRASGSAATNNSRGMVDWLSTPVPRIAPQLLASLLPFNELWVWDDERGDEGEWTTIQYIGPDCVIEGDIRHRNIFADSFDPENKIRKLEPNAENPLAGKHPFSLICPNPVDGYFWGRSELCNVAMLQARINTRLDGIGTLLRRQENPPRFFAGTTGVTANNYSKLSKPGGYLVDQNPNAKVQTLAPELPPGLYEDLHESERCFDVMGGSTPTAQGRGEAGVRSEGHAHALVQMASPRFVDRALLIERQVEDIGGLALDICQAHIPDTFTAWVPPAEGGIFSKLAQMFRGKENEAEVEADPSPIPGYVPIPFILRQLPDDIRMTVDSHSSSPVLSRESEEKSFALFKDGAISPEALIRRTHPAGEEELIEDLERAKAEKAAFAQAHPELAAEEAEKSSKKKKK